MPTNDQLNSDSAQLEESDNDQDAEGNDERKTTIEVLEDLVDRNKRKWDRKKERKGKELVRSQEEEEEEKDNLDIFLKSQWKKTKNGARVGWIYFIESIKHPKRTIIRLLQSKRFIINFMAILVGIMGALAAWAFEELSYWADHILMGSLFPLLNEIFPNGWKFLAILILPLIVAIITAPFVWRYAPEAKGSGIPNVMESIACRDGYIRLRTPLVKLLSSAICIGGGLSVGREGPITQIGAGFSSVVSRRVGLHGRNMRIVVICGLSAAISATFNAPIGGALFGIEILLVSLVADEIVPIVISSMTAGTISIIIDIVGPRGTGTPQPSFDVSALRNLGWEVYLPHFYWFLIFGLLAGLIGILYSKFFHLSSAIFKRLPIHPVLIPITGALLSALIGLASPKDEFGIPIIFGGGYRTIENILSSSSELQEQNPLNSLIAFLLIILLLKIVITSFTVGSGNTGGIFAPALFVGACTGSFFAHAMNELLGTELNISVFALTGLAAVFAGASRSPLTMMFLGAEMTGNFLLFIPLMFTCSVSYLVCRTILSESIYTQPLADKGLKISLGGNITILSTTKVEEIMTRHVISIHEEATMHDLSALVKTVGPLGFPIVDEQGKLKGIITISDLKMAKITDKMDESVKKFGSPHPIVLTGDQTADEALDILNRASIKRAPVVDSKENGKLIGILSKTDILRAFEIDKIDYLEKRMKDKPKKKRGAEKSQNSSAENPQREKNEDKEEEKNPGKDRAKEPL